MPEHPESATAEAVWLILVQRANDIPRVVTGPDGNVIATPCPHCRDDWLTPLAERIARDEDVPVEVVEYRRAEICAVFGMPRN